MATFSAVTRQHIFQAIAEYDSRGRDDFLGVYGFGPSTGYTLMYEGRPYDSGAVLGVAHRYATGRLATEFSDGLSGAADVLRRRGFEIAEPARPAQAAAPARSAARTRSAASSSARATSTRPARPARPAERVAAVCPTCSMTLPATGVCDDCG